VDAVSITHLQCMMKILACYFQVLVASSILHGMLPSCRFLVACQNTNFSFQSFSSVAQFITVRDVQHSANDSSFILNASQQLRTCGKLLYKDMVRVKDRSVGGKVASFSTSFTFQISCPNYDVHGDGLAFTFTTDNRTIGDPGADMCLLYEINDGNSSNQVFAVEFDTYQNLEYGDPSNNHIGIDINSMNSTMTYDLCGSDSTGSCLYFCSNNLTVYTAWIDYNATVQTLEVRFTNSTSATGATRPSRPVIRVHNLNLSTLFNEYMYVGFSAGTGTNIEVHKLKSWSFVSSGMPEPPPPSPTVWSPVPPPLINSTKIGYILGLSGASAGCLMVLVLIFLRVSYRKRRLLKVDPNSINQLLGPHLFTYKKLKKATRNVCRSELLGTGGFGAVYKGTLQPSGALVAVKRILHESKAGAEEGFVAEVSSISQIRHRNLVQLLGWCHEDGHLLLVYDYMPNGSLDQWIFTSIQKQSEDSTRWYNDRDVLPLNLRQNIIAGIAAALAYLHDEWRQCVLHRDIKSSNVLLDADFNAHLADFGLARLIDHKKLDKTTLMAGTLGYMAPEMPYTGKATKESDVYSFGVLVLEVVCGRRALDIHADSPEDLVLVESVRRASEAGNLLSVADARLELGPELVESAAHDEQLLETDHSMVAADTSLDASANLLGLGVSSDSVTMMPLDNSRSVVGNREKRKIVRHLLHVGLLCSQPDPSARPSMQAVNQMLQTSDSDALPPLPAFGPPTQYRTTQNVVPTTSQSWIQDDSDNTFTSSATLSGNPRVGLGAL
jgi:serine/threonine protein kinase